MTFAELLSLAAEFIKSYGSIIIGAIGLIVTVLFGGKFFHSLVQARIRHLEELNDKAREQLDTLNRSAATREEDLRQATRNWRALEARVAKIQGAFAGSGESVWLRSPIQPPENYLPAMEKSIPILLVANLKGGVGKTTIAANLVPYFEQECDERVLALDLDYQGSLSSMLLPEPHNRNVRTAELIRGIIENSINSASAVANSRLVRGSVRDSRVIDCDDPFANFESGMLVRWLNDESMGDIRYNLARLLLSADVQTKFDRVIIDAPPRLTAGFINALCASTHLVVPFVMDTLSAERVGLFLRGVRTMRPLLFPHLEVAAVVGTMKRTNTADFGETERRALAEAKTRVTNNWGSGSYVLEDIQIPRRQDIADASGMELAYLSSKIAKEVFNKLGAELYERTRGRHEGRTASTAAE